MVTKKSISEIAKKIGSKGGRATVKKHGREHMVRIIKLRWKRYRLLKKKQLKTG